MKINFEDNIYRIYEGKKQIGSVEYYDGFIENIYLEPSYRGKHLLRQIIQYFPRPITLLPLSKHREKFKHLGFVESSKNGEDIYFQLI